jgi:hypothetical protein
MGKQNIRVGESVVFVDNQVYARDREQGTRRARIFLINENTGDVYRRNGEIWEELEGEYRSSVFNNICRARGNRTIPTESL